MTTVIRYLILLAVLSLCIGCSCNKAEKDTAEDRAWDTPPSGFQTNDFAYKLYHEADQPGQNLFFSPYSISSALAMAWGGAQGETAEGIKQALTFVLPPEEQHEAFRALQKSLNTLGAGGKAELNAANALFGARANQDRLLGDYLKLLRDQYSSELFSLDFSDAEGSAKFINAWVEKRTKERIKDLIRPSHIRDSNNGLVLVNAIYFKGSWLKRFDPKQTRPDRFYTSSQVRTPETARPVQMMSLRDSFAYAELPGYQILELPYAEPDLAMLFILPEEIWQMKMALNHGSLMEWQEKLVRQEVHVQIPRFKFQLTLEGLSDILKNLGMNAAFDPDRADFSGIMKLSPGQRLYILDVIHKAFVEVKEEGTEAAAATGVVMGVTSVGPSAPAIPVFRADKPFVYMILHKPSGTILFLGKFADPPQM
ncbi:MAG: serpin family protein [Candidatus Syntrophosphaera sp.]|nr:serpin family protein [Candidatus Syntrophosphaera sp.]